MSNVNQPGDTCKSSASAASEIPDVSFAEFAAPSAEEWKEAAVAALKGAPFEKRMFTQTYEGITLSPLYTAEDIKDIKSARALPGDYPLRGNSASGSVKKSWQIAQPCDETCPAEANKASRHEIERGADAAAFKLAPRTLLGADADCDGPDGAGVSLSTLADVEKLLDGMIDKPLCIFAGASAAPLLGMTDAAVKKAGADVSSLSGCLGADPMGVLLEKGSLPAPLNQLWDEMACTIRWAEYFKTNLRTVLIRGYVSHNAGANAVQEVACVMTAAIETLRAMIERGLTIGEFSRRLRFQFSQGSNFFMEIAKLRAARRVWAQIAESFGGDADAQKSQIFARTSLFTKTVYDPYVNMLRNTTEAFSAVVGGAEGLTVGCFDEALRPGSEFSRRVARNAQIMLGREFNLCEPVDPAGGSWYVEKLTDELAQKIWAELQKIEGQGGFLKSVKDGLIQKDIAAVLQQRFKALAKRSDRAVGTNMYPNMSEPLPEFDRPDYAKLNAGRADAVKAHKAARDEAAVKKALVYEDGSYTMWCSAAAQAGATLGEMRAVLGGGKGDVTAEPLTEHRWTEQFEALRAKTEAYKASHNGDNFKVFLANMGPIPQHKARADFIAAFMEVAAFDILRNDGFKTTDECAEAAAKSGGDIAVICSTDLTYPEIVPPLAKAIKERKPGMKVYLAGEPAPEMTDAYKAAGVDGFISVRTNCLETLTEFQTTRGM